MKEITKIVTVEKIKDTGEVIAYLEDDNDGGAIVTSKTDEGLKEKFIFAMRASLIVSSLRSIVEMLKISTLGRDEVEKIAKENKKKIDQIDAEMVM